MKTSPRPHQAADFEAAKDKDVWAHWWDMGVGKSWMGIAQAERLWKSGEINALLVVAPPSVHEMWITDQLPEHCDNIPWTGHVYHAKKAKTIKAQQEWRRMMDEPFPVFVITYQAFRTTRGKNDGPKIWVGKDLVRRFMTHRKCLYVADECFRKGTPVDTPTGPHPIEDLKPGDKVLNCTGVSTVVDTHKNFIGYQGLRVTIGGQTIEVSDNHPFLTTKGWIPALRLEVGDECITQEEAVRVVQEEACESKMPVLREILLGEMEDATARSTGQGLHSRAESQSVRDLEGKRHAMDAVVSAAAYPGPQRKDLQGPQGETISNEERRKWERTYCAADDSPGYFRRELDARVRSEDGQGAAGLPNMLQDRHSPRAGDDSSGDRWSRTSERFEPDERYEKGQVSSRPRVESIQILELGCDVRFGEAFYDLEVSPHPSYSVRSLLVHNSQRFKTPGAKITRSVVASGKYAKHKRLLSGTAVTNSPFDVFTQIKFLDPDFWSRNGFGSLQSFKTTFGVFKEVKLFKKDGRQQAFQKLLYYKNLDYLCKILKQISDRHTVEEVLDLPERTFSVRKFDPSAEQMRMYKDLAREFYTWIDDESEMISSQLAITRMIRFQQILSGFVERDIQEGGGKILLKENPRLVLLKDILENDVPEDQKVIIWARFTFDIDRIMELLGDATARFDGPVSVEDRLANRRRFDSDPECRYFVANAGAAGVGLTLNAARTVIYYTVDDNLDHRLQSLGRNYRIGQTGTVNVIDLVARGLPLDGNRLSRLRSKAKMLAMVMGDEIRSWI